ncbi:hypothetical protein [Achromobacter sp.]
MMLVLSFGLVVSIRSLSTAGSDGDAPGIGIDGMLGFNNVCLARER